ncbi:hypothetical protein SAMN02927916_3111 [Flavobacterium anhuiense]|uniref:Uncharacterized protein n=1 Tax=Flavobacterium anhuiense TaxID=459526 RepID=A0ABY0LWL6_9FLAO|nr:hypothetical protein [Flavobacterium anhuiense]SCY73809.1 hypothetical protein SAMN02927916_3111 [Flavobacterium anhuiense]
MKNKNKAITYSLLSHIRNNGSLVKGPINIFIPLVKKAISNLNSKGVCKGANISEIKIEADLLYSLDFPIPVLRTILFEISKEVNTAEKTDFVVHKDDSFVINSYVFEDFDYVFTAKQEEVERIEKLYIQFLETVSEKEILPDNIFKFIEKNKFNLSKYFSDKNDKNGEDFTYEAQFISFFKSIASVYETIQDIYLGSIISCFIEYQPEISTKEVELLLDTNFIVGLLDLNTPESTHTCRTLIKVAQANNYTISVLKATIEETENLLKNKALNFDKSFLQKKINPEDVYNACDRLKITKADLERISDNITRELTKFKINILHHHDKITNEAKFTTEYEELKKFRNSDISALHDATAILYVRKKRVKPIKEFEKANCWFVNNSSSYFGDSLNLKNGFQSTTIKADDLLNILWLSSPSLNKQFDSDDLVNIGLTSTISLTLNKNLPKSRVLKELDENLCKYAQEEISDDDIVRIAKRIANKQLTDIEELNSLANTNKEEFIKKLNDEADKQKEIEIKTAKKLDAVFKAVKNQTDKYLNLRKELEKQNLNSDKELENTKKALISTTSDFENYKKEIFVKSELKKWRRRTIFECIISSLVLILIIVYVLFINEWDIEKSIEYYKKSFILNIIISIVLLLINCFYFKSLYDKYRNHSNIENYKKNIEIPKNL